VVGGTPWFDSAAKINLRPHAKTHKSVDLATLQVELGAAGICCQKVSEAEVFVSAGIPDVFITNEIVGEKKISRLVNLARKAPIRVCVDNHRNIEDLSRAAQQFLTELDIFVEIDVGGGRCGVQPGRPALDMVRVISASPNLRFRGLQVYHGKAQHVKAFDNRRNAIDQSLKKVTDTLVLLEEANIECSVVTGAGTGSYPFEAASGVYTEVQCGSYVFMDVDYCSIHGAEEPLPGSFGNSLFVLTSIMSTPSPGIAICDAGLKAHSIDSGLPLVKDSPAIFYRSPSDEHGILEDRTRSLSLGEKIYLIPGHCDPTVNLHDWYVGVRNGHVETIWPVSARGMLF